MNKQRLSFCHLLVLSLFCVQGSFAQEQIQVMSYNVLNFPLGDMENRQDTLALILEEIKPDLLLLQELKSEAGLLTIAQESFANLDGEFQASTWEALQSNPNSSWPLQQGLVYNKEVFGMIEESVILTPYRDVNAFRMFVKNEATLSGDTSYLNVFVTHLKSSQGADNEALRNEMAEAFIDALENYDPEVPAILAGDFNLYSSSEAAYQTLLDPTNPVVFLDPIDAPGEWTESSFGMPEILTQSTRSSQIYGDGAGGGLDDRFDFALLSDHFFQASASLQFTQGSYEAYGNTGLCYNGSLIGCETEDDVPPEITWALYHMSDHLPVLFELTSSTPLAVEESLETPTAFPSAYATGASWQLQISHGYWEGKLQIAQSDGRLVYEQEGRFTDGDMIHGLQGKGLMIFTWTTTDGSRVVQRLNANQ